MKFTSDNKVCERSIKASLCGVRIDGEVRLDSRDIYELLAMCDNELRDKLELIIMRITEGVT